MYGTDSNVAVVTVPCSGGHTMDDGASGAVASGPAYDGWATRPVCHSCAKNAAPGWAFLTAAAIGRHASTWAADHRPGVQG